MRMLARERTTAWGCLALLGGVLFVGCTPDPPVETPAPVVETMDSETPDPSLDWTDEERAAVDAVYIYLEKVAFISQNLGTADRTTIFEVAGPPATASLQDIWIAWSERGWRQVGDPSFSVSDAYRVKKDNRGVHYTVRGCFDPSPAYVVDREGNPVGPNSGSRGMAQYGVLSLASGHYLVVEDIQEEGTC